MTSEEIADLVHLRRARDRIDRDYAQPLDVPAMARAALMSPAHFSRKFRAAYGETPYSYLMTRRIERAKALLRDGTSVTDTCVAVGCTSLGSFSSRFTEIVGESPSQYRARDHSHLEAARSQHVSKSDDTLERPRANLITRALGAVMRAMGASEQASACSLLSGAHPAARALRGGSA